MIDRQTDRQTGPTVPGAVLETGYTTVKKIDKNIYLYGDYILVGETVNKQVKYIVY